MKNFEFIVLPASGCHELKAFNPFNKQPEFTAFAIARRDTWLKELEARVDFEQTKISKSNIKYIIKMAY